MKLSIARKHQGVSSASTEPPPSIEYEHTSDDLAEAFRMADENELGVSILSVLADNQPGARLTQNEVVTCEFLVSDWIDAVAALPHKQMIETIYTIIEVGAGHAITESLDALIDEKMNPEPREQDEDDYCDWY